MDIKEHLRKIQSENVAKRKAELEQQQKDYEAYLESEAYERDQWENYQELWAKSFAEKGLHYEKKPFISALQRQRMEEQAKQEEIAHLQQKLKVLQGDV